MRVGEDYEISEIKQPGGPWTYLDPASVPSVTSALAAPNSVWLPGSVITRTGFAPVWNPNQQLQSMFSWISSLGNWLVYFSAASGGTFYLVESFTSPSPIDLYSQAAFSAVIAPSGPRVYMTTFTSAGVGVGQAHVVCFIVGDTSPKVDACFLGPLETVPSLSNTGTGVVTAGLHRVGYIVGTRSGFVGKISPTDSNGTFLTTSNITAPGGQTISFSLTATFPAETAVVYPVISPASQPARYFIVPGLSAIVDGGLTTVTFSINIDDNDLLAAATQNEVTNNQYWFTQGPYVSPTYGAPPFSPFSTGNYGDRQWYLTEDAQNNSMAYMSEPSNPQQITADQHVLTLPGFRQMKAAFQMNGIWYCLGPNWTYAWTDTGDVPVLWGDAQQIDASVGAYGPLCTSVDPQGFAFVGHQTGLYLFSGGYYEPRPLTYYRTDLWKQINWAGAGANVQVINDKDAQRCYVICPLGSATVNNTIIVIDYVAGLTPETVKISEWTLSNYATIGAGCMMQNVTTMQPELWIGTATKVLRHMATTDANPYNDDGAGIPWTWQSALQPTVDGTIYYHYITQLRARGNGNLYGTIIGLDASVSQPWTSPISLTAAPGQLFTQRYPRLRSEGASVSLSNNGVANAWAQVSDVQHYYAPGPAYR